MTRTQYYEEMKALARQLRVQHGLSTPRVSSSDIRRIYKCYGIAVDLWPLEYGFINPKFKKVDGAFFNDELGATIMINRKLPEDPKIFTMCHEFKHFLVDKESTSLWCGGFNKDDLVEISANVFAAEFIFPEQDFIYFMNKMIAEKEFTPAMLVQLKRDTKTTLSYAGLVKRTERLGFAEVGSLSQVKWKKLEEEIYGTPSYKKKRFQ